MSNEYKEPLPAQIVTLNSKKYGYEFSKLSFAQVMYAEERAQLKSDRLDYISDNPGIATENMADVRYRLEMAGILFVPVEGKKFKSFDADTRSEIEKAFMGGNAETYKIVEGAIIDFFTQRGNRNIASKTLLKSGSLKTLLKLSQVFSKKSSSESDSTNAVNLNVE